MGRVDRRTEGEVLKSKGCSVMLMSTPPFFSFSLTIFQATKNPSKTDFEDLKSLRERVCERDLDWTDLSTVSIGMHVWGFDFIG